VLTELSSLYQASKYVNVTRIGLGPVVSHRCETWFVTLREEHGLRVLENRVLRKIFWPKRDEVTGDWRKLHKEGLRALKVAPNIIRMVK
jgi:hypothetical protein